MKESTQEARVVVFERGGAGRDSQRVSWLVWGSQTARRGQCEEEGVHDRMTVTAQRIGSVMR